MICFIKAFLVKKQNLDDIQFCGRYFMRHWYYCSSYCLREETHLWSITIARSATLIVDWITLIVAYHAAWRLNFAFTFTLVSPRILFLKQNMYAALDQALIQSPRLGHSIFDCTINICLRRYTDKHQHLPSQQQKKAPHDFLKKCDISCRQALCNCHESSVIYGILTMNRYVI